MIAWQHPKQYGGYPMIEGIDWRANAQQTIDNALDTALGTDSAKVSTVHQGHAAKVLLDASAGAELLAVGHRGHGGFTEMLLGSVSEHVVTYAMCPVLVKRHTPHR